MGDIDVDNFTDDLISEFNINLLNADYISIDLEMSGISLPNSDPPQLTDSFPLRFSTIKQIVSTFGIIQFEAIVNFCSSICLFGHDD